MIDFDLAELYSVETAHFKRQVRRNLSRFPEDFMFRLKENEYKSLRRQIGILKRGAHSKYLPYAFSEQGVAMLSSVLEQQDSYQGQHTNYPCFYPNESFFSPIKISY